MQHNRSIPSVAGAVMPWTSATSSQTLADVVQAGGPIPAEALSQFCEAGAIINGGLPNF